MAKLLVLNVKERKVYEKECEELQDFYDALECDCFDIAHLNIGGKYFDCFVDDEGLFKDDSLPSAIGIDKNTGEKEILLVGNIVFANHDSQGNTTSLSERDMEMIRNEIILGIYGDIPLIAVFASY